MKNSTTGNIFDRNENNKEASIASPGLTLYERVGYRALKLFRPDQIAQWLIFLRHNKQSKEENGQVEKAHAFGKLIADFTKAEQEIINGL